MLFNLDKTKQCAHFRHRLPSTNRQTDRQIHNTITINTSLKNKNKNKTFYFKIPMWVHESYKQSQCNLRGLFSEVFSKLDLRE